MGNKKFSDILILLGGISFLAGVLVKISGQDILFPPVVYWRFAMGSLALAIALLLQRIAEKK